MNFVSKSITMEPRQWENCRRWCQEMSDPRDQNSSAFIRFLVENERKRRERKEKRQ